MIAQLRVNHLDGAAGYRDLNNHTSRLLLAHLVKLAKAVTAQAHHPKPSDQ